MKGKTALVMAGILLVALVALAGCGSKSTTTPTSPKTTPSTTPKTTTGNKISIVDFSFNPSTLTIKPGDTVTWTNTSAGTTHTVTSTGFDSGQIAPGGTFQHTFPTAGTFDFHCSIHTSMTGKIIVTAAGGGTGSSTTPTSSSTPGY